MAPKRPLDPSGGDIFSRKKPRIEANKKPLKLGSGNRKTQPPSQPEQHNVAETESKWKKILQSAPKPRVPRRKTVPDNGQSEPARVEADTEEAMPPPRKRAKPEPVVTVSNLKELFGESDNFEPTRYLGLDCEMVGVGDEGTRSVLAQVCIVNYHGNTIYCKHVKPKEKVTDHRTHVSGVTPEHLRNATAFETVQNEVADIIKDRIVVGHGLKNDFHALMLSHPKWLIRDTTKFRPLLNHRGRPMKLKTLTKMHLGAEIQTGSHAPDEDACAALLLFRKFKTKWEQSMKVKDLKKKRKSSSSE